MRKFHAGQKCIIVQSHAGNVGKIVTLVNYLGKLNGYLKQDWWEVEETLNVVNLFNGHTRRENVAYEEQLMPLKSNLEEIEILEESQLPIYPHSIHDQW
jgi:hypothetical protein